MWPINNDYCILNEDNNIFFCQPLLEICSLLKNRSCSGEHRTQTQSQDWKNDDCQSLLGTLNLGKGECDLQIIGYKSYAEIPYKLLLSLHYSLQRTWK